MASKGDFHTHSTASDGRLTPSELVDLVASQGVRFHALTDHDSTEGIAEAREAAQHHPGYKLIPGVEMGTDIGGQEVHMLGLFLDPSDAVLQETLSKLREGRLDRGQGIVEKLRGLGVMIEWGRVREIAGEAAVGRPHIAEALVEKGYVTKVADAFDKWIGRGGPAYVERLHLTPVETVQFIIERGGLACWAHPAELGRSWDDVEPILRDLKTAGMQGVEVFYKDYAPETVERMRVLAEQYDLLPLGGSDYHGIFGNNEPLPGDIPLPDYAIERLFDAARQLPNRALAG
jgi:predicted metal-dependent phosphoesterase TrpH